VAVIDSGVSFSQENLDGSGGDNSAFNSGESFGRVEERMNFLPERMWPIAVPLPGGGYFIDYRLTYSPNTSAGDNLTN